MLKNINIKILIIFIFVLMLIMHFGLIVHDPWLRYDDWLILTPLTKIHGLFEYFLAVKNGLVLDLQPIRDLSYLFDLKMQKIVPWYSLHFVNVMIWIAIVYFFTKIVKNFSENEKILEINEILVILLFALTPIASSSIAWLAARKHLLSFLFILICTEEVTKKERNIDYNINLSKICVFYILSIYSQPINLFWPVWYLLYCYSKERKLKIDFKKSLLFLLMFSVTVFNWYYFSVFYSKIGLIKFVNNSLMELVTNSIMRVARYFQIIIYPFSALPTPHNAQSMQNILGLLAGVTFIFFLYFNSRNNKQLRTYYLIFSLYFIVHLAPVLFNSAIFCSDTYVLNASVGLYLVFYFLLKQFKKITFLICIYLFAFLIFNFQYIENFTNTKKLFNYSLQKEATPDAIIMVAENMITDKKYNDAFLISKINQGDDEDNGLLHVHSKAIYLNPTLTNEEKILKLNNLPYPHPTQSFMLALMYLQKNDQTLFYQKIIKAIDEDYFRWWINKENNAIALGDVLCSKLIDKNFSGQCEHKLKNSIVDFSKIDHVKIESMRNILQKSNHSQLYIDSEL